MKIGPLSPRAGCVYLALIFLAAISVLGTPHAIAAGNGPFTSTTTLETESTIHLGDPIIVDISLANISGHRLVAIDGPQQNESDPIERQAYRPGWYGLALKDDQGNVVASELASNTQVVRAKTPYPSFEIFDSGSSQTGYCPVSRLLNITNPGRYVLTVNVYLPYADAPPDGIDPVAVIKSAQTVFTSSIAIQMTVLPFDASHAQAAANALCRKIQDIRYDQSRVIALADALFGMPEAVAYHAWRDLASVPRGNMRRDQSVACVELARLNTVQAADILAGVAFNAPLPREDRQHTPEYLLQQMYNRGDVTLRKYIRSLYYYHGVTEIPDQFPKFGTIN